MPKFFITFPWRLEERRNKFHEIQAPDRAAARKAAFDVHRTVWAFLYDEKEFAGQPEEFGLTPLGEPIVVSAPDPTDAINL